MTLAPPLKVGLIGLGQMGQNHLRVLSLLKSVELAFVIDQDAELAVRLGRSHGVPGSADLGLLLPLAEAVIIATPTKTHAPTIRRIAPLVRNIFVEKPMSETVAETRSLLEFASQNGLRMQIGFIERFNPAVQQLKRVLDESAGVISIDFTRTNKLSARITDVDVVTDLMIHDIDLALHLNGPVRTVTAHGVAHDAMIAFASALLTHENGRFSRIQASRITEKKIRTIQATCIDMFVDCELVRKELLVNRQSEIQQREGGPYTISSIEQTIQVPPQEALLSELQTFVSFCRGDDAAAPTPADALNAALICEQVQRAVLQ